MPRLDPEVAAIVEGIAHPARLQVMYQVREIFLRELYLQHGLTVEPGDVVFDVGANVGVAAAYFSALRGATVHSFEPVGPTFAHLAQTAGTLPSCTPHNVALGRRSGTAEIAWYPKADAMSGMYVDPAADRASARAVFLNRGMDPADADERLAGVYEPEVLTCEVRTLSEVIAELGVARIDLLKVDVERAELDVLAGLDAADWPKVRQLVVEIEDSDGRLAAVTAMLDAHGFTWVLDQDPDLAGTDLHILYARR